MREEEKALARRAIGHVGEGEEAREASLEASEKLLQRGLVRVELFDGEDRKWYPIRVDELPYMGNKSARMVRDVRYARS